MPTLDETTARLTQAGLNLIQQALSIYDRDLRLVVSNRQFREMFALPIAFVVPGASFADTIRHMVLRGEYGPVADPEAAVRRRVEAALAFEPHYMERQRPDGRWISVEGTPLSEGGWITVYTDITGIKRQEALLRTRSEELSDQLLTRSEEIAHANRALASTNAALVQAQLGLAEAEARIRTTTEMMPAHIAHVDRRLRYTYSNRRLPSVIPGARSDILGLTGIEAMGPSAFAKIEPHLRDALNGTASVFEFTDDPSGRRIRAAFTPDAGPDGTVNGVYILSTDVTPEAQARAALAQTHKRELAAQLTSGLAHDFGNLLTIILGLQSRLQRMDGLPAEAHEAVAATLSAARRGGVLLGGIAGISGMRPLSPAPLLMRDFLAGLKGLALASLPEGISLAIEQEGLAAPIIADAGSLQDSLLNLILNARDAISLQRQNRPDPTNRPDGRIRLVVRPIRDTWLEIRVEDNGPGFTAEALERALDPFFTTKGAAGSGLGLSIVYDQTRILGGTLRLENQDGGGAAVSVRLPLRWAEGPARPRFVLLVEDDPGIREAVREMLRDLGHTVIEAEDAGEALALAEVPGIDLVLSDIRLAGGRTGLDLAQALQDRGMSEIGLMTSLPPGDALRQRAQALGLPVLSKPFGPAELTALLARRTAAAAETAS